MLKSKDFVKKRLGGQPTLYNSAKHLELMYEVFNEGKDVSKFCKEADIGRTTFYNWLKRYKEFREAYEILLNYAESYWHDKSEVPGINHSIWLYVMKTRFNPFKNYFEKTCLKGLLDCKTVSDPRRTLLPKFYC